MRDTDGDRLCWGTLTRLPVRPPDRLDRHAASGAMLSAPMVGAALGIVAGLLGWGIWALRSDTFGAALGAVVAFAFVAWATRALHLDGLADTADALGSGLPAPEALAIARKSDIGPFGVIALIVVAVVDVIAMAACLADGLGVLAIATALVAGRLALPVGCLQWVPAARPDGLGATVARSVKPLAAAAVVVGWLAVVGMAAAALAAPDDRVRSVVTYDSALIAGVAAAAVVLLIARRRLGGITGDVLGAMVEVSTAVALLVLALA